MRGLSIVRPSAKRKHEKEEVFGEFLREFFVDGFSMKMRGTLKRAKLAPSCQLRKFLESWQNPCCQALFLGMCLIGWQSASIMEKFFMVVTKLGKQLLHVEKLENKFAIDCISRM